MPNPKSSVKPPDPLTPHLCQPDAMRTREHFLKADMLVDLHSHPSPQLTFSRRGVMHLSTDSAFCAMVKAATG